MQQLEAYEASTTKATRALEAAKDQRLSLRRAIADLEAVLAQPPTRRGTTWTDRLAGVLAHLDKVFAIHIAVTEGAGGLYEEILTGAPRLANKVARFKREHTHIATTLRELRAHLGEGPPTGNHEATAAKLLDEVTRHRKRGLDLVYEAYHVDIGGES